MTELTEKTVAIIRKMFPPEQHREVGEFLRTECGDNFLSNGENFSNRELERIRFAVLKMSGGNIDDLLYAVQLAQIDWRDVLMAAGFGNVKEHVRWANKLLGLDVY